MKVCRAKRVPASKSFGDCANPWPRSTGRRSSSHYQEKLRRAYPQLTEADAKTIASYVSQNLHSRGFLEVLGGDAPVELRRLRARVSNFEREPWAIGKAIDAVSEIISSQVWNPWERASAKQ